MMRECSPDRFPLESQVVEIRPLQIDIEDEDDGRILASIPELPGRYGVRPHERGCSPKSRGDRAPDSRRLG